MLFLSTKNCDAQNTTSAQNVWPQVKKETHPWTRWWWMGNAVDEQNISSLLKQYHDAGIGGVEITPIYGAVGFEQRYLDFLSPKWMDIVNFTVQKAGSMNMGVDMNTGTGWPFGGPQITPELAASKLFVQKYQLKAGEKLTEKIVINDPKQKSLAKLQALMAYGDNGETEDVTSKVEADGTLNWQPKTVNWQLLAAFDGKSRQMVKRAAPGGEGLVMDHLQKKAVDVYLARFDASFKGKIPGIGNYFNDSYEVFGADWSPALFDEFQKYRGYNLKDHLQELTSKDTSSEKVARVKSDYRETMSDMLLHNFTENWTDWAHKNHSLTRNQSHGSPGNLLDLYGTVDVPECETFGSSYFPIPGLRRDSADIRNVDPDPMMFKFATSAAHVNGKPLASSETFTWLAEHFKGSLSQCKPEVENIFLSGVNHVFFHGTAYSPQDVPFPGWLFYASVNFSPTNTFWPHIKGMNDYITRCQSVLQDGKADNDVLMYWPVYDVWNQAKGMEMLLAIHGIDKWLRPTQFYQQSKMLTQKGFTVDFISDTQIDHTKVLNGMLQTNANASPYKTIIIPECKLMPVATLRNILQLANNGATVIFQKLPEDVPGLNDLENRRNQFKKMLGTIKFSGDKNSISIFKTGKGMIILSADLKSALDFKQIKRETLTDSGLEFNRRSFNGGEYYYLVNHTAKAIDQQITLNDAGKYAVILDPQTGSVGLAETSSTQNQLTAHVQLQSGEAVILKVYDQQKPAVDNWVYLSKSSKTITLNNSWNLHFTEGGPELPADQKLTKLISWPDLADPKATAFSGSGVYTGTINLPVKTAKEYMLNLGRVAESAHVWINGQDAGIIWANPFEARIGKYLHSGMNTIKVEVANLMANRIRDMDQKGIKWRNYHEINFVNINYLPFDAAKWKPMISGLIGPVVVTPYN
ncbi:MAG: glycoside hydrolase [Sphingobacteriaceae bacterium]|nr:MAG: glycoside hydrolase [Sphingobacteriaceae bacterium]